MSDLEKRGFVIDREGIENIGEAKTAYYLPRYTGSDKKTSSVV